MVLTEYPEKKSITIRKSYSENLIAPVHIEQVVGKIDFMLNDVLLGSVKLLSNEEISKLNYMDYYHIILNNFFDGKYLY